MVCTSVSHLEHLTQLQCHKCSKFQACSHIPHENSRAEICPYGDAAIWTHYLMDSKSHSRQAPSSLLTELPTLEDPIVLHAHLNHLLSLLSRILLKILLAVHMWNSPDEMCCARTLRRE